MIDLSGLIAICTGIALRLAIPILVTAVLVLLLRRLDAHWQSEARPLPAKTAKPACWEVMHCPPERRAECAGFASALPCWQARRTDNGYLREQCLGCKVFLKAPIPEPG